MGRGGGVGGVGWLEVGLEGVLTGVTQGVLQEGCNRGCAKGCVTLVVPFEPVRQSRGWFHVRPPPLERSDDEEEQREQVNSDVRTR